MPPAGYASLERLALDILHADNGLPVELSHLMDLADKRVIQLRRRLGFAQEASSRFCVGLEFKGERLERY